MAAPAAAPQTDNNERKIFVGGLSAMTTHDSLKAVFQAYGAVETATVMEHMDQMTGQKRSRGFGFVVFAERAAVDNAVAQHRIMVDDKECEIKGIDENKSSMEKRKIFVGGLADTVDNEKLRAFFATIDPDIVEARVMHDPVAGRSRCFGFVTFSADHFVQKAMANGDANTIDGKWVDVKPSGGKQGGKSGNKGFGKGKGGKGYDNYGGGKGYGQQNYGGYGGGYGKGGAGGYEQGAYGGAQAYGAAQPAYGGYAAQQPAAYAQYAQQPAAAAYGQYNYAAAYGQQPAGAADPSQQQAAYAQQYAQQQAYAQQPAAAYGAAPAAGADPYAAYRAQPY